MRIRCLLLSGFVWIQGCSNVSFDKAESVAILSKQTQPVELACDQDSPRISCSPTVTATFDQNGVLWLAWVENEHVFVQSSPDKGKSYSAPVRVNQTPEPIIARDEYRPKIQLDKHGHIYLTWTRSLEKRHTGHIRFSRSLDGGETFSEPVTVNDNLDMISHRFDSLSIGDNGEIFIAWLDARDKIKATALNQEFAGTTVYYTWSDTLGESFYPNQAVAAHSCECCRLATAIDQDNLPVVAWRAVLADGIRDHALVKFKNWHTPGMVQRLSRENWQIDACPHHGPAMSIDQEGVYHLVWFSGEESKQGLFYANTNDHGASISNLISFGTLGAKHPHVLSQGQKVAIAWLEFDGVNTHAKFMQSSDAGKSWTLTKTIASVTGKADYVFLVADQKEFYLSWQAGGVYNLVKQD